MRRRPHNPRRVKQLRSYTVNELAILYCVHRNTVRNWMRVGLEPMDGAKPLLFLGRDVCCFLQKQRQARRQPCEPGTFYCLRCRAPRRPKDNCTIGRHALRGILNLQAECDSCGATMFRRAAERSLSVTMPDVKVQNEEAGARIR